MAFGYRVINLKYKTTSGESEFGLDVDMGGPVLAFLFSF